MINTNFKGVLLWAWVWSIKRFPRQTKRGQNCRNQILKRVFCKSFYKLIKEKSKNTCRKFVWNAVCFSHSSSRDLRTSKMRVSRRRPRTMAARTARRRSSSPSCPISRVSAIWLRVVQKRKPANSSCAKRRSRPIRKNRASIGVVTSKSGSSNIVIGKRWARTVAGAGVPAGAGLSPPGGALPLRWSLWNLI